MRQRLCLVLIALAVTSACTPIFFGDRRMRARAYHGTSGYAAASAVGRWDNVMMLEPGSLIRVLTSDGAPITGRSVVASLQILRLRVGELESELDARNVVRVDLLATPRAGTARQALRGAGTGLGIVGVLGLLLDAAPPPRVFATGAIVGAKHAVDLESAGQVPGTIYLAESAIGRGRH
jgi:hypothetical protein